MKPKLKNALALAASTLGLSACYVVPVVDPQGNVQNYHYPLPPAGVPVAVAPGAVPVPAQGGAFPVVLNARLYPDNDIATRTGVVTGTVANMMTGKGRFQLNYKGEVLTGEATRVDGDARRGVASAFSPSGAYMSCEYQMSNPRQGAGTCSMSNGAKYQAHIGS